MLGGLSGGGEITHVESKLPLSSLKHARKKGNAGPSAAHPLGGLSYERFFRQMNIEPTFEPGSMPVLTATGSWLFDFPPSDACRLAT